MNRLLLSLLASILTMVSWAGPNGKFRLTQADIHSLRDSYKFADTQRLFVETEDQDKSWDCEVVTDHYGNCTLNNLLGKNETLKGSYDSTTGKLVLTPQIFLAEGSTRGLCGGVKGYTEPQGLMDYFDKYGTGIASELQLSEVKFRFDEASKTLTLQTPIVTYEAVEDASANLGRVCGMVSALAFKLAGQNVDITVNEAAGVRVVSDLEEDREVMVGFTNGHAQVEGAHQIRIYNVEPYEVKSVKVNGKTIEAQPQGNFYCVEVTQNVEAIAIETEQMYGAQMSMNIIINGLYKLDTLSVTGNNGSGRTLVHQHLIQDGLPYQVSFTEDDLPILVFGSWNPGPFYKMEVTLDGENIEPSAETPSAYMFTEIRPHDGSTLTITISVKPVTVTVNDASGVNVEALVGPNFQKVFFQDGTAEIDGASRLDIYNVAPYTIKS